ncbi:UNVERIFIED_CONTAM: hypothetical protein RMT77_001354 [Armadillidium vulgare]
MAAVIRKSLLGNKFSFVSHSLLSPKNIKKMPVAGMISKALRDKDYKRPPAFPYKEKPYGIIASLFDKTTWRFDENTKLIVVDGPVTSGKKKLAKALAEEFDLLYLPPAHLDSAYINSYGFDFRMMNDKLPPHLRSYDVEDFLANPKDKRRACMEYQFFCIRFRQYLDALIHILNTGQGVILDRCVFGTSVFADTYMKHGFLPADYKNYTIDQVWNTLKPDMMRPHLIIYLDTPVDVIRKNLEKKNNPLYLNSPVMQPKVLEDFENNYKFNYLQEMSTHAELLIYDNSEDVETEIVVEDIERVNLDDYGQHDPKMKDWRLVDENFWNQRRIEYTRDRDVKFEVWLECIPGYYCDELIYGVEDMRLYKDAFKSVPGNYYQPGFNTELGDSVLFKWKGPFFP